MTFGGGPYTRYSRFGFGFFGVVFRVGWGLGFRVVSFDFWGARTIFFFSRFGFGFFGVVFRVGWGLGFRALTFGGPVQYIFEVWAWIFRRGFQGRVGFRV